jgi:hypothetical protein
MTGHPGYRLIQVSYPVAILRRQIDWARLRNKSACGGQASVRSMPMVQPPIVARARDSALCSVLLGDSGPIQRAVDAT